MIPKQELRPQNPFVAPQREPTATKKCASEKKSEKEIVQMQQAEGKAGRRDDAAMVGEVFSYSAFKCVDWL